MKTIRFNFGHPVKGVASLIPLFSEKLKQLIFKVDSKNSNMLEIPISKCEQGKWKLTLDWEHNDQIFSHHEEFEVEK
jgi:hypothetical protein